MSDELSPEAPTPRPDGEGPARSGTADDSPPPRQRLGDFEILGEIGRGGMGIVYEARQVSLNRRVALKVLPPALGMTPQSARRFRREAQAAARLHHTNIVPVHAIGREEGFHFYAMELIEGQSLDRVLNDVRENGQSTLLNLTMQAALAQQRRGGSREFEADSHGAESGGAAPRRAVDSSPGDGGSPGRAWFDTLASLVAGSADGLDYAHGRGIVHRDIKPANLMLSREGRLCVMDFGLARMLQEPGMTLSGSFLGTPAYMSPEQIAAGRARLDHRTDVYSLGAVLYEMLVLRRPFPGEAREEVVTAIMTKDPRPPRRFNSRVPVDLETICLKAMEKDPDRRYATAGEMAADLRRYLHGGLIAARRANLPRRAWKSLRRHPVATTVALAAVLSLSLLTLLWQARAGRQAADAGRQVSEARLLLNGGEYRAALAAADRALSTDAGNREARLIRARVDIHRWHWWDAVREARAVLAEDPENWEAHLLVAAAAKKGGLYSVPASEHVRAVEQWIPDRADAHFLRGWVALYDERYREAVEWLTRALDADPGHALALEARSDAFVELKDLPAALADAEHLSTARPRGSEGPRQVGYVHMLLHDEARALDAFARALALDPQDARAYFQRSRLNAGRGRIAERIADLTRAIELDAECTNFHSHRGAAYLEIGDYERAIRDHLRALELNPEQVSSSTGLFRAYWDSGRTDEARALLAAWESSAERWIDIVGKAWFHEQAAALYATLGNPERSVAEAERAVALLPNAVWAHWRRVRVRQQFRSPPEVDEACDRLAALEPTEPGALYERAGVMSGPCGRTEQALADQARVIELAPNWSEPYVERGGMLRRLRRFREALSDYARALELTPSWPLVLYDRGRVQAATGRFEPAVQDYERSVALGGEGSDLRRDQAYALLRLGREAEALAVLEEFLRRQPEDPWGHVNRAEALFRLGRVEEALASAERAVQLHPGWAVAYDRRATYAAFRPGGCDRIRADLEHVEQLGRGREWSTARAWLMLAAGHYACAGSFDAAAALELARDGAAHDPANPDHLAIHGVALYRAGRYAEAAEKLRRASELRVEQAPVDLFFLAMAEFDQGRRRAARADYKRADSRLQATFPRQPLHRRIRREAATMLGIDPS